MFEKTLINYFIYPIFTCVCGSSLDPNPQQWLKYILYILSRLLCASSFAPHFLCLHCFGVLCVCPWVLVGVPYSPPFPQKSSGLRRAWWGGGRGWEGEGVHDSHEASTEQLCVRQAGGRRQ